MTTVLARCRPFAVLVGASLAVAAISVTACGGDSETGGEKAMSTPCKDYLTKTDDERQTLVQQAADELSVLIVPAGVSGGGAPGLDEAREIIDGVCRSSPITQVDEAIIGQERELAQSAKRAECQVDFSKCNGGSETGSTTDQPTETTGGETTEDLFEPARVYRREDRGRDGSTTSVRLDVGSLGRINELPADFADLPAGCNADPQRDAAMPMRMTLKNTTKGFAVTPTAGIALQHVPATSDKGEPYTSIVSRFSDGPSCKDTPGIGAVSQGVTFDELAPGASNDHDFVVLLRNYYTPEAPDGDPSLLAEGRVGIGGNGSSGPLKGPNVDGTQFRLSEE